MSEEPKKILIVIAPRNFRDEELSEPIRYFEEAGIPYQVVSTAKGLAVGTLGGKMLIDTTLADIVSTTTDQFSAIVIVGGGGSPDHLWDNHTLHKIVRDFESKGKIVSAICLSPVVLAKAGILKGKKVTVWNDDQAIRELENAGAIFRSDPIVVDGMIITANGPSAAAAFGEKVVKAVKK